MRDVVCMRVLIVWLLAAGVSAGQEEIARHLWSDAMELRSRHYVVETNTFPEEVWRRPSPHPGMGLPQ